MSAYPGIAEQKRETSAWMPCPQEKEGPCPVSGLDTATNCIDGAASRAGNFLRKPSCSIRFNHAR
ncbi:hypothetical protein R70211_05320 [Paraburkholderia domus]|uniref:Uncharacterized protein n=1 Tax=Paraburkholderia domus TaxID=2793075 RepID=A0A9N8N100_9BURK|nr:hypothetical protein R70211_05320 [Paraburkholderia domus]